jgi:hypothetical protein
LFFPKIGGLYFVRSIACAIDEQGTHNVSSPWGISAELGKLEELAVEELLRLGAGN